jgi:hypothetical protein
MIEKEKLPEWIDRYNNNKLHGKDLEEFVELMKNNEELKLDVKLDKDLNEIIAESDVVELRRKIIKNKIPKESNGHGLSFFLFAASVTIVVGMAILAFILLRKTNDEIMNAESKFILADTVKITKKQLTPDEQIALDKATIDSIISRKNRGEIKTDEEKLLADNYMIFPPYEGLIGETSRAGYFKLLKPKIAGDLIKGSVVTFSWETILMNTFTITITNNKGQQVFVSPAITGKNFHFNTSELSGGLYYYKFIHNDEIIYFGKFTLH